MLDADDTTTDQTGTSVPETPAVETAETAAPAKKTAKKAAKKAPAERKTTKKAAKSAAPAAEAEGSTETEAGAETAPAPRRRATKKAAAKPTKTAEPAALEAAPEVLALEGGSDHEDAAVEVAAAAPMVLFQAPQKAAPARKRTAKKAAAPAEAAEDAPLDGTEVAEAPARPARAAKKTTAKKTAAKKAAAAAPEDGEELEETDEPVETDGTASEPGEEVEGEENDAAAEGEEAGDTGPRRRRRRGGRRRRKPAGEDSGEEAGDEAADESVEGEPEGDDETDADGTSRRRRTRVRKPRNPEDEITSIGGSTRLEAKKQRRREGREAGRRRAPIVSEAEFLARREAVDRVMVIRQRADLTQIGVLEDKVLVEHYVARESQTSLIGNIYLGRVQNVLPSMEAAFIDIGKGRNAVLYAGEVNWSALGHKDGQPRKVESVLKSGQTILVQVTKDPVGHKGARLTGQISLPGRFLVYVPDGNTSGISRKLPDTERNRLKNLLKEIVPDTAGVIVRTAAEGASEEELTQDVERLTARWADIEQKVAAGRSPELLYGEPDLTLKVVRDLFTEDFNSLIVEGDDAWDLVDGYVSQVAPDLRDRLKRFERGADGKDVFAAHRVDEQIAKGLDRKVWLPSGGSLVIDRTEAMTVVDVNTGKFTGSGGNLEETVTKNNLEAAEEIVRQLRLRDIGGIIVVDFIDMVLESNRDLVLRRLVECLGRDRTRHQVAEVTSLGLVQMTRKRIGTGLLEAFSEDCDHCKGRGIVVHEQPIEGRGSANAPGSGGTSSTASGNGNGDEPRGRRSRGGRGRSRSEQDAPAAAEPVTPSPMALAGTKPHVEPATAEEPGDQIVDGAAPVADSFRDRDDAAEPAAARPVAEPAEPAEPAESTDAAGSADATAPAGTADTEVEAAPEPVAAPVVVTTTRRRRAGRPAGPAGLPVPETVEAVAEAPAEVEAAEAEEAAAEPAEAEPTGETSTDEHGNEVPVFHVPIKKKGSRKR